MKAKKPHALVLSEGKDGRTKVREVEIYVDRTRRPLRPELREQIEAWPRRPKKKRKR